MPLAANAFCVCKGRKFSLKDQVEYAFETVEINIFASVFQMDGQMMNSGITYLNPVRHAIARCLLFCGLLVMMVPAVSAERKKVALVLSGGGARGMAHIGVLKAIEKAGIPIDFIVGTSMGSIIGGLYAIGYTPMQLDSMIKKQNWSFLLSDNPRRRELSLTERERSEKFIVSIPISLSKRSKPMMSGLVRGQNLSNLFSKLTIGYHDSIDFNRLPIPFACVATNIVNGEEYVYHRGVLATAIRASMAIPGYFTPVRQDSMVLVDGGLTNNYPVDVARAMGADIIIGATVQQDLLKPEELNNVSDILTQLVDVACRSKYESNIANSDFHVRVDTKGFTSMSFEREAIDSLVCRGEQAVRTHWDELLALKRSLLETDGTDTAFCVNRPCVPYADDASVMVRNILFLNENSRASSTIMKKCKLREHSSIKLNQIESAVNLLRSEFAYLDAYYTLESVEGGYDLKFHFEKKSGSNVNLGIRFDTEDIASLLVQANFKLKTRVPSSISLTGRLGKQYQARLDYTLEPLFLRNINLAYQYRYNDVNVYQKGDRVYNMTYHQHQGDFSLSDTWFRNLRYSIGLNFEYFHFSGVLSHALHESLSLESEHFFNYYARLQYNTLDRGYYPSRGVEFTAGYTVYTDNLWQYADHTPFSAVHASWMGVLSLSNRFSLLPSVYGRIVMGKEVPLVYSNALGGYSFARYVSQQMPFAGIAHMEIRQKALLVTALKARQRMGREHYLTAMGNMAVSNDKLQGVLNGKFIYGFALGYGYNSKFGPLEAYIGYSDNNKQVECYANLGFYF